MNDNLKSFIRDLAKFAAGAAFLAPLFIHFGINPAQLPSMVEWVLGIGGIAATIWSQVHAVTHIAVPLNKLTATEASNLEAKKK